MDALGCQVRFQQGAGRGVDLPVQDLAAVRQHLDLRPELRQRLRRFQAEQAGPQHDRAGAVEALHVVADRHRVVGIAQDKAAFDAVAVERRDPRRTARAQDEPVVAQRLAGRQRELATLRVDARHMRVEPRGDTVLGIPLLGQQVQALDTRRHADQLGNGHPVVGVVVLAADEMDLAVGVATPHMVGRGQAGHAVAHDHDAADRRIEGHDFGLACLARRRGRLPLQVDADGPGIADARHAGQARAVGAAEPGQRRPFVAADGGEPLAARHDGDRVGAAHAGTTAGVDGGAAVLERLEQGLALADGGLHAGGVDAEFGRLRGRIRRRGRSGLALRRGCNRRLARGVVRAAVQPHRLDDDRRQPGPVPDTLAQFTAKEQALDMQRPRDPRQARDDRQAAQRGDDFGGDGHAAQAAQGADDQRGGEPVVQRERGRREEHRRQVARLAAQQFDQVEERQAGGHVDQHLHDRGDRADLGGRRHEVVAEDQARKDAREEAAEVAVRRVRVVLVGQVRRAGVEVVAVLGAAHARFAVRVGDADERRLAVQPLHRQQGADAAAPAALALEQQAADERRPHGCRQQAGGGHAVAVEQQLARDDRADQQADADRKCRALRQAAARECARDAEPAGDLVDGGQRADVAPQPGCQHEHERERRHDQPPEQGHRGGGPQRQHDGQGQGRGDAHHAQRAPHRFRHDGRQLHEIGENESGRGLEHGSVVPA
ncbi:hypothetical protein D9M72_290020 [compost metagenome]